MKKLFGTKTKSGKGSSRDFAEEGLKPQIPTPLYQKLATHGNHILQAPIGVGQPPALALAQGGLPPPGTPLPPPRSAAGADDERWEVVPTPLPSAMSTAPQGLPPDHLPNPHSPPSSALPPPPSAVQQIQAQHPQQLQQGQAQGGGQPIATVTPPSRTSSFTSLQASTQQQPAQAPLPSAQHHPSVGVLPPRSGSPMSTASATTNKLVKHRDRERERAERDAYAQSQSGDTNTKDKKKKKPSQPTAPVALGILRALDPPRAESGALSRQISEERATRTVSESGHGQGWGTSTYTGSVAGDRDPRSGYHRELSAGSGYGYREREPVPPPEKEKEKKRGFWSRDKDKDKDKDKERAFEREREKALERERVERDRPPDLQTPGQRERLDNLNHAHPPLDQERGREPRRGEENGAELTRMIGYLTATASEDWALVLDVCDRASANEANAKEAVRALRREFKYGEPAAQLSAARLWAIMLRNSSDIFITQSTTRKFLDTLEDLLSSSRTSPVVRERLLEVVAAAAYASGSKKGHDRDGFKGLWRRVKPFDKPDEGVPFDTDDAMFHPPSSGRLSSGYDIPSVAYQEPTPPALESAPLTPAAPNPIKERSKRRSPTRSNRIIPPDEDMRRLFQECKIGQGNASLLAQALVTARPEDLKRQDIIREFYVKCRASQELIYAQIPWATAGAERAVANKEQRERERGAKNHTRNRTLSNDLHRAANAQGKDRSNSPPDGSDEGTQEEKLLAALLAANAELVEVLKQYDDLERVAMERKAEDRSRKEIRMDPRQRERLAAESGAGGDSWSAAGGGASATTTTTTASRTPSPPSPQLSYQSHQQHLQQQQQNHYQQQQQQLSNNNPYQQQRHQYPYQQPPAPPSTQLAQPRPKHPGLPESYSYSSDINLLGANNSNINPSLSSVNANPAPNSNPAPNPNLAPPPAAPHGPRSPAQAPSTHSRASSPATPSLGGHGHGVAAGGYGMVNGHSYAPSQGHQGNGYGSQHGHSTAYAQDYGRGQSYGEAGNRSDDDSDPDYEVPVKPSAKALGKRKVVEPEVSAGPQFDPDDIYATQQDNQFYGSGGQDPENLSDEEAYSDSHQRPAWARQPTHFVYDAVAERTKEWQMQLRQQEGQERTEGGRLMQQPQTVGGVANGGR